MPKHPLFRIQTIGLAGFGAVLALIGLILFIPAVRVRVTDIYWFSAKVAAFMYMYIWYGEAVRRERRAHDRVTGNLHIPADMPDDPGDRLAAGRCLLAQLGGGKHSDGWAGEIPHRRDGQQGRENGDHGRDGHAATAATAGWLLRRSGWQRRRPTCLGPRRVLF